MKNIALIGFMGSGKTTLASLLAIELQYGLCELDNEIISISGYTSINEIFDKQGEEHFRGLEKIAIADALRKSSQVISCGGGIVSSPKNMELLKKNAIVVFLQADFKTITKRLKNTDSRPLFRDIETAIALYAERLPLYNKYADIVVETDDKTPEEIAGTIIKKLESYGR
jgi:shikimate kinase